MIINDTFLLTNIIIICYGHLIFCIILQHKYFNIVILQKCLYNIPRVLKGQPPPKENDVIIDSFTLLYCIWIFILWNTKENILWVVLCPYKESQWMPMMFSYRGFSKIFCDLQFIWHEGT